MAIQVPDDVMAQILESIKAGRKIEAIKIYREATNEQLKDSKEAVEAIEAELREKYPDQFPKAGKSGCLVLLGVFASGAIYAGMALLT